jgi:sulfur-oxidizing protein SoxY
MMRAILRILLGLGIAIAILDLAVLRAPADSRAHEDAWLPLANEIFKGRPLADGTGLLALEMPSRAEDAAIVPLTVRATLPPTETRRVKSITIVIDENPAPLTATFHIGPSAIVESLSTRVRVNSYTFVHAVAELSDGMLYVINTYVKASGGCSAPASKNTEKANIGEMRFRQFEKHLRRQAHGSEHDPSPEQFRAADGSTHASLYSGFLRAVPEGLAR